MPGSRQPRLPFPFSWMVTALGWLVPRADRLPWKRLQLKELAQYLLFLRERGESVAASRRRLFDFCRGAFRDALGLRFPGTGPREQLERLVRAPAFVFAATGVLLVILMAGTGLFWGIRTLYRPLPLPNADRLVSCYQVHFLSVSFGVQSRYIQPWQQESKALSGLEAYQVQRLKFQAPGRLEGIIDGARVTPGFFPLLGVSPAAGRFFRPEDTGPDSALVVSHAFWRAHFGTAEFTGKERLTVGGRTRQVLGVLPRGFWFRSPDIQVWTLLPDLSRPDPALRLVNAVGMLSPGTTLTGAREELQTIAWRTSRFRGGAFRVVPLAKSMRPELQFPMLSFLAGTILAFGIASVQYLRTRRSRWDTPGGVRRYWAFFPAKVALIAGFLLLVWAELSARNALAFYPSRFLLGLLIDWASILFTLLLLRWAILDHSRRCPVCLRRLATPITSGRWSSSLLEPASIELLCDQGHGALHLAESYTTLGEIQRWVYMEDSWRELLASEEKT